MNATFRKGRKYRIKPLSVFSKMSIGRAFTYKGFDKTYKLYLFEGFNKNGIKIVEAVKSLDEVEPILENRQSLHTRKLPV